MSTDESTDQNFMTRLTSIKSMFIKEKIASENLIFSPKKQYITVFAPILLTFIVYPFRDFSSIITESTESSDIAQSIFASNVEIIKVFTIIIISYLFSFSMTRIESDGSYGYWLALGADRRRFIYYLLFDVTLMTTAGMVMPVILLSLFTALKLSITTLLLYITTVIISQIFLVAVIFFFTELLAFAEIEFSVLMIIYLLIDFFAEDESFARKLLFPEYFVYGGISIIYPLLQVILAIGLGYIGLRFHLEKDIELGG